MSQRFFCSISSPSGESVLSRITRKAATGRQSTRMIWKTEGGTMSAMRAPTRLPTKAERTGTTDIFRSMKPPR